MMIVRDAEKTIRDCMDSILQAGCFQQIVIVIDTRTRDNTVLILQAYAAQCPIIELYFYKWKTEDYAAARNASLSKARTQYGYWQDSDEVLIDKEALCALIADPKGKAYHIYQISRTPDGGISTHLHQLRLFPIRKEITWELPVHEQLAFSTRRMGVKEEVRDDIAVYHTGYAEPEWNAEKHKKYYRIMTKWLNSREGKRAAGNVRQYVLQQYNASRGFLKAHGKGV